MPPTLKVERHGAVAVLTLARAKKRNALDDPTVQGIETFFSSLPDDVRAVVLCGDGDHFSAGLDLAELAERNTLAGVEHSRFWHRAFECIEFGAVPVVAVLHGAVVGGGLELAAAAHVRVAERSAFYALPEPSRGIYVGGGGSVRLPPLIGAARVMDMMLTGRTLSAEEGQAIGLTQYLVDEGQGLAKGLELAHRIAGNAPFTQFRRDAFAAADRAQRSGGRLCHRSARRRDRARRRGGQGAAQGFLGKARAQSGAQIAATAMSHALTRASSAHSRPPLRPVKLGPAEVSVERRGDGAIVLRSPHALPPYSRNLTERLMHWAKIAPDRVFLAQRDAAGGWRALTYADTLAAVRAIAAALLQRKLSPERPVAILSGNDIEHALLGLAAMHVGIPYAPISVPYSLLSQDFGKLKAIMAALSPGLVFAADGAAFARAIAAAVPASAELAVGANPPGDRRATDFAALSNTAPTPAVDAAHAAVAPDTIAKILFTSGSTGEPKGVINTQLMLCANQAMIGAGFRLPPRRAARRRRLAAVESHVRRQPQFRPGARQRRLALYRRGQAAAGRRRRDGQ